MRNNGGVLLIIAVGWLMSVSTAAAFQPPSAVMIPSVPRSSKQHELGKKGRGKIKLFSQMKSDLTNELIDLVCENIWDKSASPPSTLLPRFRCLFTTKEGTRNISMIGDWCQGIVGIEGSSVELVQFLDKWNKKIKSLVDDADDEQELKEPPASHAKPEKQLNMAEIAKFLHESIDWEELEKSFVRASESNDKDLRSFQNFAAFREACKLNRFSDDYSSIDLKIRRKGQDIQTANFDVGNAKSSLFGELARLQIKKTDSNDVLERLSKELEKSTAPIWNKSAESGVALDVELVEVSLNEAELRSAFAHKGSDKKQVKVIAGESGSGKTVFSVLASKKYAPNTKVLYVKMDSGEMARFQQDYEKDQDSKDAIARLRREFRTIFDVSRTHVELNALKETKAYELLSETMNFVSSTRNSDAWKLFEEAIEETEFMGSLCDPKNAGVIPGHITVVVDEATSVEFGHALVAIGRNICVHLSSTLKMAETVDLVIAGTGLERLEGSGFFAKSLFGTDPSKARLIVMGLPCLKKILHKVQERKAQNAKNRKDFEALPTDWPQRMEKAIHKGTFSRILCTNSRMLFEGLVPIVTDTKHTYNLVTIGETIDGRIAKLGSIREIMDFALRWYLKQNTLGKQGQADQVKLIDASFEYHLKQSQESLPELDCWFPQNVPSTEDQQKSYTSAMNIGLLRSDGKTSNALKLLSTLGLSSEVFPSDGDSLETFTILHLMRMRQANGGEVFDLGSLEHGWPPACYDKQVEEHLWKLKNATLPVESKVSNSILAVLRAIRSREGRIELCFFFKNGTRNAQGADVIELRIERSPAGRGFTGILNAYQCKNVQSISWPKSWSSLGVRKKNNKWITEPECGYAGYSYEGLRRLCSSLSESLRPEVTSVNSSLRVVVTVKEGKLMREGARGLPRCCKIMPMECLDPTISIFPIG